jgi:hypothetical protein
VGEVRPVGRTEGLISSELDGELVVYDDERKVACSLSSSAALVWKGCDGTRGVADLVTLLAGELGELADEDVVMIALDTLAEHGLIASGYERREPAAVKLSRRRFVGKVGLVGAAAIAMPVVASLVVPTPASAASGSHYFLYYGYPLEYYGGPE